MRRLIRWILRLPPKPKPLVCVRCGLLTNEAEWKLLPWPSDEDWEAGNYCSHVFGDPKDRMLGICVREADVRYNLSKGA